jgi:aminopeptidase N
LYTNIPAEAPFWSVQVGDPGPDALFDFAVYARGAMTLHQLRLAVGDEVFFEILDEWDDTREQDTVTTAEFIALAEEIAGQELSSLFDTWLFTTTKPVLSADDEASVVAAASGRTAQGIARKLLTEGLRHDRHR